VAVPGKSTVECRVSRAYRGKLDTQPDVAIARLAAEQWGVVSLHELLQCGVSDDGVERRVKSGRLHRIHRGVYAVGHPNIPLEGRFLAATKACGPTVALSHYSAAALWGLVDWDDRRLEVTVPGPATRTHPGIRVHRSATLARDDVTRRHGIWTTTPARTILDLSGRLDEEELEAVIAEAHTQDKTITNQLTDLLTLHRYHRGIASLRALMESHREPKRTRSRWERRLLKLIRQRGLPEPQTNAKVHGHEVDLYFPDHQLVVEFDSFTFHSSRRAFETDRYRDQRLAARGIVVLRVTWLQLTRTPEQVVDRIAQALSLRSARARG